MRETPSVKQARSFVLAIAVGIQCLAFRAAAAQSPAELQVRVRSIDDKPVEGANVRLRMGKTDRSDTTGPYGVVRFEGLAAGRVALEVRAIGFGAASFYVEIAAGDNELTVTLERGTVVLEEVRVIGGRNVLGRHENFEARVRRGEPNAFITQDEIERRNSIALSQMLRRMAGLQVADSLGATVAISTRGAKYVGGKMAPCVMRVMVDGIIMSPSTSLDAITPKDIYGVEVYYGPSRIPLQMRGERTDSWCGLVAIWTR